jgi:uncharacterized membrane protein YfhO
MENKYYVYLHIKETTGEPFYIGKGKGNRAYQSGKNKRSLYWHNIVNKYGYDIIFLELNLTDEEAIRKEIYWINRIGRKDLNEGPLVNLTDGGEGLCGRIVSDETRKKISEAARNISEETRKKMSDAKKNISEETRKKMSESARNISEETRKKMSDAKKNMSDETRKKMSESRKGKSRKHSDETKEKIKLSWIKRKENKTIKITLIKNEIFYN